MTANIALVSLTNAVNKGALGERAVNFSILRGFGGVSD